MLLSKSRLTIISNLQSRCLDVPNYSNKKKIILNLKQNIFNKMGVKRFILNRTFLKQRSIPVVVCDLNCK